MAISEPIDLQACIETCGEATGLLSRERQKKSRGKSSLGF